MARGGRYFLAGQPLHVIQRGNNRQPVFFGEGDYRRYRDWLTAAAAAYGCAVHAYVLMTNHVHLLVTPERSESLPQTMQSLGRRYVPLRQRSAAADQGAGVHSESSRRSHSDFV